MDSLNSILQTRNFDEPPEIESIKKYIQDNFAAQAEIKASQTCLTIIVNDAALASALRFKMPEIKRRCQIIDKKIFLRIR